MLKFLCQMQNILLQSAKLHRLIDLEEPDWSGNQTWPPPNEPLCGYAHQKALCQSKPGNRFFKNT